MQRNKPLTRIGESLSKYKFDDTDKYISREFQKYGYDLAQELGDPKGVSLYIKLAKETPRILLENARSFVRDAYQVQSKPKLFMWKLAKLKEESKIKNEKK
jgi:hypothetical protein